MQILAFLFEIDDKVFPVQSMYVLFSILGVIGLVLGFWRRWLSACWLIFPTIFVALVTLSLNIGEMNYHLELRSVEKEFGESYIWHNYISVIVGILLNLIGLFVGIFKPKNLSLQ